MKKLAIKNESGSREEGSLVIGYLILLGGNNRKDLAGDSETLCYYINNTGSIAVIRLEDVPSDYEITTIRALLLKNTVKSEYPKLMYVSDQPIISTKNRRIRVVFMEKCGKYIAWDTATTIEESERVSSATGWEYAIDYVEPKVIELSIEGIAEKLEIAPNLPRIKQ